MNISKNQSFLAPFLNLGITLSWVILRFVFQNVVLLGHNSCLFIFLVFFFFHFFFEEAGRDEPT